MPFDLLSNFLLFPFFSKNDHGARAWHIGVALILTLVPLVGLAGAAHKTLNRDQEQTVALERLEFSTNN